MYEGDIKNIFIETESNVDNSIKLFESTIILLLNRERNKKNYPYQIGYNNIKRILKIKVNKTIKRIDKSIVDSLLDIEEIIFSKFKVNYDRKYIMEIYEETMDRIKRQISKMANIILENVKKEQILIRRIKRMENTTMSEAFKTLKELDKYVEPEMYFVDKASRKWRLDKYFKMLVNNMVYSTAREIVVEIAISKKTDNIKRLDTDEIISLSEYYKLKDKNVFHPNSKKLLSIGDT